MASPAQAAVIAPPPTTVTFPQGQAPTPPPASPAAVQTPPATPPVTERAQEAAVVTAAVAPPAIANAAAATTAAVNRGETPAPAPIAKEAVVVVPPFLSKELAALKYEIDALKTALPSMAKYLDEIEAKTKAIDDELNKPRRLVVAFDKKAPVVEIPEIARFKANQKALSDLYTEVHERVKILYYTPISVDALKKEVDDFGLRYKNAVTEMATDQVKIREQHSSLCVSLAKNDHKNFPQGILNTLGLEMEKPVEFYSTNFQVPFQAEWVRENALKDKIEIAFNTALDQTDITAGEIEDLAYGLKNKGVTNYRWDTTKKWSLTPGGEYAKSPFDAKSRLKSNKLKTDKTPA